MDDYVGFAWPPSWDVGRRFYAERLPARWVSWPALYLPGR